MERIEATTEKKRKRDIPSFLLRPTALATVFIVVMAIKLQTPMKVYIAVDAVFKKMVSYQVGLQRVEGGGTRPLSHGGTMGEHGGERDMHHERNVERNRGGGVRMRDLNDSNATLSENDFNTGQFNRANYRTYEVFTIFHYLLFSFFFPPLVLALHRNKLMFKRTKCWYKKGISSCLVNITGRI